MKGRISREEALSFILTHLIVERQISFEMNQLQLFNLMNLATEAETALREGDGLIPHEVIEELAERFLDND